MKRTRRELSLDLRKFPIISSLDRAVSDMVSCLSPSVAAWLLRLREMHLSGTTSSLSKSKALFAPLYFLFSFEQDLLISFQEEVKVGGGL